MSVPKRKKGESLVEYHDRLAALIREAEEAGNESRSRALQRAAGKLAAKSEEVRAAPRPTGLSGPGTYPWYECVGDQLQRGYDRERSDAICGRIRADSRKRYPEYWAECDKAREPPRITKAQREITKKQAARSKKKKKGKRAAEQAADNPLPLIPLAAHAAAGAIGSAIVHHAAHNPEEPFCAIGLDGGPRFPGPGPRDNIVVVSRTGAVLAFVAIYAQEDMVAFNERYPDLPVFGPFHVLARDIRDLRRQAEQPVVQHRRMP